jgi:hypothetical protein
VHKKYLSTRNLVEEFIAAEVWPLIRGWVIPEFGDEGPEGLYWPHPTVDGFAGSPLSVAAHTICMSLLNGYDIF